MKNSSLTTSVLVVLFTSIIMVFSLVLFSQSLPPNPMETARKQTAMMEKRLDLSLAQLINVSEINEKYALKMVELFNEGSASREETVEKIMELMDRKDKELMRVLTEEQYGKWLNLKTEKDK